MSGLLLFAVVALIAFISKAVKSSSSSRSKQIRDQTTWRFQQARERLDTLRQFQQQPRQQSPPPAPPQPGPQPFHQQFLQQTRPQPGPSPYGPPGGTGAPAQPWQAAWAPVEAPVEAAVDRAIDSPPDFTDLREDPHVRQFLPDLDPSAEPADLAEPADGTAGVLSEPTPARDLGSAALESTLDSSIESSLFGAPSESALTTTTLSTSLVGRPVTLPPEIETRVLALLNDGHEVAAVRLICDELNCGLLDAMRTVQTLPR